MAQHRTVDDLIVALHHDDPSERAEAAAALGRRLAPQAVEPLLGCLADEARHDRGALQMAVNWSAVEALGELADACAVDPLVSILAANRGRRVSFTAQASSGGNTGQLADMLTNTMRETDRLRLGLLCRVATALGNIRDRRAVQPLIEATKTGDEALQMWAGVALASIGDPRSFDALIELLQASNPTDTCRNIATALSGIGERAIPSLSKALGHRDRGVRYWAADALAQMGDRSAIEPLMTLCGDPDDDVRSIACEGIDALESDRATQELNGLREQFEITETKEYRALYVPLFVQVGKRHAVPLLLSLLSDDNADTRAAAAKALGDFGEIQALPQLQSMVVSDSGETQEGAALPDVASVAIRRINRWNQNL